MTSEELEKLKTLARGCLGIPILRGDAANDAATLAWGIGNPRAYAANVEDGTLTDHLTRMLSAAKSDPAVYDDMRRLAAACAAARVEPAALQKFGTDVLSGRRSRPVIGLGRTRTSASRLRTDLLVHAIDTVVCHYNKGGRGQKIFATRNDESQTVSGCDIVAAVAGMKYDAVKKIYTRR